MSYPYGLVQDCSNSIANTLELLQSCTKPSISRDQYQIVEDIGLFNVSYSADTKNAQILQASLNVKYIAWSTTVVYPGRTFYKKQLSAKSCIQENYVYIKTLVNLVWNTLHKMYWDALS